MGTFSEPNPHTELWLASSLPSLLLDKPHPLFGESHLRELGLGPGAAARVLFPKEGPFRPVPIEANLLAKKKKREKKKGDRGGEAGEEVRVLKKGGDNNPPLKKVLLLFYLYLF